MRETPNQSVVSEATADRQDPHAFSHNRLANFCRSVGDNDNAILPPIFYDNELVGQLRYSRYILGDS